VRACDVCVPEAATREGTHMSQRSATLHRTVCPRGTLLLPLSCCPGAHVAGICCPTSVQHVTNKNRLVGGGGGRQVKKIHLNGTLPDRGGYMGGHVKKEEA